MKLENLDPEQELSPEDTETLESLLQARRDDDAAVVRAVEAVLLPSLGELGDLRSVGLDLTPLALFLATDAVAMLVRRTLRGLPGDRDNVVMTPDAAITSGSHVLVRAEVVIAEIAHVADVSMETATRLATEWIPHATRRQPQLFLGIECELSGRDLHMTLPVYPLDDEDLFLRWKVQGQVIGP